MLTKYRYHRYPHNNIIYMEAHCFSISKLEFKTKREKESTNKRKELKRP